MSKCGHGALAALAALSAFALAQPAAALSMKECSEKYKATESAGTMSWNDFRKAECGPDATMQMAPAKPDKTAKSEKAKATERKAATAEAEPTNEAGISSKECSERYQAAKSAGTLGGLSWNEFRNAGCPMSVAKTTGAMVPTAATVFPAEIAKKYARQSAGKARRMTCLDQYRANKAAGVPQPKWTQTGGGYYSECNRRLTQQ